MAVLKDVFDIVSTLDGAAFAQAMVSRQPTSISKTAAEGTLQFPVLISRALDITTCNMICSALEREYASFAQIALTMNCVTNYKTGARGHLAKFHQNSDMTYTKSDLANDISRSLFSVVTEEGTSTLEFTTDDGKDVVLEFTLAKGSLPSIIKDNKNDLYCIADYLNYEKLNDKYKPINLENAKNRLGLVTEANRYHDAMHDAKLLSSKPFMQQQILKDNDVKKSNELVPTTLHIRLVLINDAGESVGTNDFIIGVKAIMHPISSEEMIDNIYAACNQHGKFFDFVKWTTGEISFMKDLVLNLNETKRDVFNRSTGASPWWLALKRRKNYAKMRNQIFLPGGCLPNTTVVVSMDEAEYIKTRYGYDLLDPLLGTKIMNHYFLLGVVIVDMGAEIAHFLFDGQKSYQSVSFEGLRRETSNTNNINEVIKMANRLRL